jgi:hypothetical protein
MTSARMEELLDKPLRELTDADIRELAAEMPDEWAYLCVRIRDAVAEPRSPAHTALYLQLMRSYPCSRDVYRERAEDARWRRLDRKWRSRELTEGMVVSVPYSAGAQ